MEEIKKENNIEIIKLKEKEEDKIDMDKAAIVMALQIMNRRD